MHEARLLHRIVHYPAHNQSGWMQRQQQQQQLTKPGHKAVGHSKIMHDAGLESMRHSTSLGTLHDASCASSLSCLATPLANVVSQAVVSQADRQLDSESDLEVAEMTVTEAASRVNQPWPRVAALNLRPFHALHSLDQRMSVTGASSCLGSLQVFVVGLLSHCGGVLATLGVNATLQGRGEGTVHKPVRDMTVLLHTVHAGPQYVLSICTGAQEYRRTGAHWVWQWCCRCCRCCRPS